MGGLFGSKAPAPVTPPPPAAPIEEATFQPGAEEKTTDVTKRKLGKKRLQIPTGTTTTAATTSGLSI